MPNQELEDIVWEALDNAVENTSRPRMMTMSPSAIAYDMIECCADLEDYTCAELLPYIESWLSAQRDA